MGEIPIDYDGVFRFQRFLHSLYGMPLNGSQERPKSPGKASSFFRELVSRGLSSNVCVDLGDIAAADFCSVEEKNGGLDVYIAGDSDCEIGSVRIVPKRLEVIIDPDPRKSYAAIFRAPKKAIEEVHGDQAFAIDKKVNCMLLYPHGSLLMEKAYKEKVLVDLGVQFSPQDYKLVAYENGIDWHSAILDRVVDKVIFGLAKHYKHARVRAVDTLLGVPVRGSGEKLYNESNSAVVSFDIHRSRGMKKQYVEKTIQLLLEKFIPFHCEILSNSMPNRITKVSILFELPA